MARAFLPVLGCAGTAGLLLFALQTQPRPPEPTPPLTAVRLSFGWRDTAPRNWDGRVEVQGGRLVRIEGWRLTPNDSIDPAGAWRMRSAPSPAPAREVWPGAACALEDDALQWFNRHPLTATGVFLYLEGNPDALRLAVETPQGNFDVPLAGLRIGRLLELLDGHARAELLPASSRVESATPEQDYPALAAGPDGSLWLAYQSYEVARHQDHILVSRLQEGRWSEPQEAAGPGIYYRPQLALDGRERLWVVWAALVNEDWDLYGRYLENGRWSQIRPIAAAPGGDINHRLAADSGGLWLAWQGNRKGNWDIFVSRFDGTQWSAPEAVTSGPENDWEPAIAADGLGRVVVAWDSLRRGSFNVYMRIRSEQGWQPEMAVASGEDYEAHATLALDRQNRIWVAWDNGGPNWGLDSACNGLYRQRHIDVRAWTDAGWQTPLVKPMRDLPLPMTRFVSLPQLAFDGQDRLWVFFRHWTNRAVYEWYAVYLTASGWSEPALLPESTGREYQHFAAARAAGGRLWTAWSSDGSRQRTPREKHYGVWAAPLPDRIAAGPDFPLQRGTPPPDTTVTVPREPERYSTTVAGKKLSVYWGDMHRHTDISSHRFTDGSLEDTYRYGVDVARHDFFAPTDHVTVATATMENIRGDDYHWWRIQKAADLFRVSGVFVPVYAYERSMQSPGGHRNLLYLKRGAVPITGNVKDPRDNDPRSLWEKLRGQAVIVTPHTPADVMQPLISWDYQKPDFEPLLEIYQGLRSSYEYRRAPPGGRLGGTQTDQPGHFFQDALSKGLRYGVQASSDHLATHINFTGVYAEELSREALFRALQARHTFAASDKILVEFRMGEHFMGDEFRASAPPPAHVKVFGTGPLRSVELVRNGEVLYSAAPGKPQAEFTYRDTRLPGGETWYYVRVIQADGNMAWSSPIWLLP